MKYYEVHCLGHSSIPKQDLDYLAYCFMKESKKDATGEVNIHLLEFFFPRGLTGAFLILAFHGHN